MGGLLHRARRGVAGRVQVRIARQRGHQSDLDVRADLAAGFRRWEDAIRDGLAAMRDRGELRADADPLRLTYLLLAAYQGGMLLAQAERDVLPLAAALHGAIDHIATFLATAT